MSRRFARPALAIAGALLVFALAPASSFASSWTLMSAANPSGGTNSSLLGVSCPSATWCTAVGTSDASGVGGDIAETWSSTWSLDNVVVNPERKNAALNGVSCPLVNSCFAAGYYGSFAGHQEAQVQTKSGTSTWSVLPRSGEPGHTQSALVGISCVAFSVILCEAVGNHTPPLGVGGASAFYANSAGATYDSSVIANPGDKNGILSSVACPSGAVPYKCFAAGQYGNRGIGYNMIQVKTQASGGAPELGPWSLAGAPNWSAGNAFGAAISCTSASFCMSVGRLEGGGFDSQPVGLLYNGSTWSLMGATVPAGGAPINTRFQGVSCAVSTTTPTRTVCNAVGSTKNSLGQIVALAERWDSVARTWTVLATPMPAGTTTSVLNGVSCSAVDTCVAVGSYNIGSGNRTLALQLRP
jgi:hypothetical protein